VQLAASHQSSDQSGYDSVVLAEKVLALLYFEPPLGERIQAVE